MDIRTSGRREGGRHDGARARDPARLLLRHVLDVNHPLVVSQLVPEHGEILPHDESLAGAHLQHRKRVLDAEHKLARVGAARGK